MMTTCIVMFSLWLLFKTILKTRWKSQYKLKEMQFIHTSTSFTMDII